MEQLESRPAAVCMKGHAIFQSVEAGHSSVQAIARATGLPHTTILRVLSLLIEEDDVVATKIIDGELNITVKNRRDSRPFA